MNTSPTGKTRVLFALLIVAVLIFTITGNSWSSAYAQDIPTDTSTPEPNMPETSYIEVVSPYFSIEHRSLSDGTQISGYIINGPPEPPAEYEAERAASILPLPSRGIIAGFPSYSWVFGCSAVSGAMIAAYYDNNGYDNMYAGPTNGGVMPLTDTSWATWYDGFVHYPNNPLIASHNGVDGRATKGSIDDYWVQYGSSANDPYIGNWTEHTWSDAIGDYMKTSQTAYSNTDGSTAFWNYSSATKLTCSAMVSGGIDHLDGTYGRKLFYEARGYTVTDCYNQNTDNNYAGGFSLADFQAEIDAGHPVLLNLDGHSIVGYGYDGSTIYIRDTWDNNPANTYTMTWGTSYSGMDLLSVSVVHFTASGPTYLSYLPMIVNGGMVLSDPILNGDFEAGQDGSWTEFSTHGWDLITHESSSLVASHGGVWHVWLGGDFDDTSQLSQSVLIAPGLSTLHYWYWIGSEESACGNDYFKLKVDGTQKTVSGLCISTATGGWVEGTLDLSAYAGSTVTLMFEVITNATLNSNVFLDDVSFAATRQTAPAPLNSGAAGGDASAPR